MFTLSVEEENDAIKDFGDIIRFPTISSLGPINGSYRACSQWLLQKLLSFKLEASILPESLSEKPIVIATYLGSNPELPCILLNRLLLFVRKNSFVVFTHFNDFSHYDVVPVIQELWDFPAFEAIIKDGRMYGRGTQDMKSVCVQYLTAIKKLKTLGFQPQRTINLSFVPDEEISGLEGMEILRTSNWFSKLNVGLALDEGLANETDQYSVFYGERVPWWITVKFVLNYFDVA